MAALKKAKIPVELSMKQPSGYHMLSLIQKKSVFLQKRPILLLEVMIAIALIVLAAIPLIYPHVYLLRAQSYFLEKVELDHVVNLHFVDLLEQLYLNKVPWGGVVNGQEFTFSDDTLSEMGYKRPLPFKGNYRFKVKNFKPKGESESPLTLYLLDLDYSFYPKTQTPDKKNQLNYHYNLFVVRDLGDGILQLESSEDNVEEYDEDAQ